MDTRRGALCFAIDCARYALDIGSMDSELRNAATQHLDAIELVLNADNSALMLSDNAILPVFPHTEECPYAEIDPNAGHNFNWDCGSETNEDENTHELVECRACGRRTYRVSHVVGYSRMAAQDLNNLDEGEL